MPRSALLVALACSVTPVLGRAEAPDGSFSVVIEDVAGRRHPGTISVYNLLVAFGPEARARPRIPPVLDDRQRAVMRELLEKQGLDPDGSVPPARAPPALPHGLRALAWNRERITAEPADGGAPFDVDEVVIDLTFRGFMVFRPDGARRACLVPLSGLVLRRLELGGSATTGWPGLAIDERLCPFVRRLPIAADGSKK